MAAGCGLSAEAASCLNGAMDMLTQPVWAAGVQQGQGLGHVEYQFSTSSPTAARAANLAGQVMQQGLGSEAAPADLGVRDNSAANAAGKDSQGSHNVGPFFKNDQLHCPYSLSGPCSL